MNAVAGAGYNINRHHSIIGQFMWSGMSPDQNALRPIWSADGKQDISGSTNLFAATANYRFQMQGKKFGGYVIGGAGWYYRYSILSRVVSAGQGVACLPAWGYWGFSCAAGTVTDVAYRTSGSSAAGGNAGAGFTIRINEEGYKFFVETRYHYAPHPYVPTRLIPITLGILW